MSAIGLGGAKLRSSSWESVIEPQLLLDSVACVYFVSRSWQLQCQFSRRVDSRSLQLTSTGLTLHFKQHFLCTSFEPRPWQSSNATI